MTPTPNSEVPGIEQPDPVRAALDAAVDLAHAAATEEAGVESVGAHVGIEPEQGGAATHLFETNLPGYQGWRWAVTVACGGPGTSVTVSEVVLLPGPDALVAPEWVPWQQRVQAGDLGVGDLMPTDPGDPRLVPAYLESDDPAIEDVATDVGLGRVRVMSRYGRLDAADRWQGGQFGPRSDMARSAPLPCGQCGFYLPIAGALRSAFGVCGNELSPADGHVVHVEYGCGAHSEVELELASPVPVADLVYDDTKMDIEHTPLAEPVGRPSSADEGSAAVTDEDTVAVDQVAAEPDPAVAAEPVAEVEAVADPVIDVEPEPVDEAPVAAEADSVIDVAPEPVDEVPVVAEVEPAEPAPVVVAAVAEPVTEVAPEPVDEAAVEVAAEPETEPEPEPVVVAAEPVIEVEFEPAAEVAEVEPVSEVPPAVLDVERFRDDF